MLFKKGKGVADEGKNWYKDKYQYVLVQRNILAATTLMALFSSAVAVFAVMQLTPHKSVEPFVIQIDEKSGIVQRVDPVTRTEFTSNEAVDRYFVVQYIRARESYIRQIFLQNYNTVRTMSDPRVFAQYREMISEANPESPMAILKSNGRREVAFKSISFLEPSVPSKVDEKIAQARFTLTDYSSAYPLPQVQHNIVTMTFRYLNINLTEEERFINPLGFYVTNFSIEREVVRK